MKWRVISALFLLAMLFGGCSGKSNQPAMNEPTVPSIPEYETYCPWEYDVCAEAVQNETMHYYFMSSEGKVTNGGELEPSKWGDSCLIVFPDGQTMLVDAGVTDYGPILVENLKRMGIKKLHYIVITHPHTDHQNGIFHADNLSGDGVLDQFEIGQIYHRGGLDPKREDSKYVDTVCTQRGLVPQVLEMGDILQIGPVTAEVLWPKPGTSGREITGTANTNNSSIVIRFAYADHTSLFAGDLYDDGEFALLSALNTLKFDVDLLKVPHHGGYTSSCSVFLDLVSPELAVSMGYCPIRDDVMNRYKASDIPVVDDWNYGYIHVTTDGNTMTWESSRQEPIAVK